MFECVILFLTHVIFMSAEQGYSMWVLNEDSKATR